MSQKKSERFLKFIIAYRVLVGVVWLAFSVAALKLLDRDIEGVIGKFDPGAENDNPLHIGRHGGVSRYWPSSRPTGFI